MASCHVRVIAVFCLLAASTGALQLGRAQRPVDPWVFSGSFDDHPKSVLVALHQDLWLAYDTQRGDVDRVWPGTAVEKDIESSSFVRTPIILDEVAYHESSNEIPWRIFRNGTISIPRVKYRGYRLFGEQLTMMYTLITEYGHEITVEESPEVVRSQDGRPGLQRVFYIEGLPDGYQLGLEVVFRTLKDRTDLVTDGLFQHSGARTDTYVWGKTHDVLGRLMLHEGRTTTLTVYFAPAILNNRQDVATLEPTDVFKNTRAIQGLSEGELDGAGQRLSRRPDHEPGAAVKIYGIGESIERLAPIAPGQFPSAHVVVSNIDLRSKEDFGGLDFYFITHIQASLNIASAGVYKFRVEADDGFRLTVGDSLLIEHDGLQAARLSEEVSLSLSPGVHPLLLEHFQSTGRKQLTLYWMPPWSDEYKVLGAPTLSTKKEEEHRTTPGKKRILMPLTTTSPELERRVISDVHPAIKILPVENLDLQGVIGGIDRLSSGELVIATWNDGQGEVSIVQGLLDEGRRTTVRTFAQGMSYPLGIQVVDDEIFVLQRQELTQLIDNDGTGGADEFRVVGNDWHLSTDYQELSFGLEYHAGWFYAGLGVPLDTGGAILMEEVPERGSVVRIGFDGSVVPVVHGLHIPNGIEVNRDSLVVISDHRNPWFSDSRLLFWQNRGQDEPLPADAGPARPMAMQPIWLPPGPEAPTQPFRIPGGPYEGDWLFGDLNNHTLKRISVDVVNGAVQGAVFMFSDRMPFSVGRFLQVDDENALIGGMSFDKVWLNVDHGDSPLSLLAFGEDPAFEMKTIRAEPEGFSISFTQPLDPEALDNDHLVKLYSWPNSANVRRRSREMEAIEVTSVELDEEGTTLRIRVAEMNPESIVYFNLDPALTGVAGETLWTNEGWYSLNVAP